MRMYQVRRVHIGKTAQLDELAHECGLLYSQTLVFFWRTVRHKSVWLKEKHLKRLFTSRKLHAHTADACVEAFFASLKSWRERKKAGAPDAHPPRRRKWYFRIEYKRSAMSLKDGHLRLSNGKGNLPLILDWVWELPQTVVIGDVRDIRQDNDVGHTNNQKIHQWSHGSVRFKLTYKAERLGMAVALQDEHYTSRTCPCCGHVRSKVKGRVFRCPKCGWTYHRDGVGSINIRQKYLGHGPVVGVMAPPISIRLVAGVARTEKLYVRENVCVGNCTEAAGL